MRNVCATVGILVHHLLAHLVARLSHGSNGTPNNASKIFSENLAIFVKTSIQHIFRFPSFCIFAFQNLCNFISNQYAARILYPVGNIYYYYLHRLVYVLTMNEALGGRQGQKTPIYRCSRGCDEKWDDKLPTCTCYAGTSTGKIKPAGVFSPKLSRILITHVEKNKLKGSKTNKNP
ncbi:hypothetical protein AVEN_197679-1 [Araneus ventricosus]|uniref:Secreted protein n=1 Tax=Araneus ventricosus TaxID=182803 RepID=A0A4Y2U451_ARAVE|nr:hypothetical protein AVEN_197679-1 [Araneus ventricosus]